MTIRDPLPELSLSTFSWTAGHYLPHRDDTDVWDLDAPYQRGSVWNDEQRQNLIRSFLIGVPVGAVTIADLGRYGRDGKCYRIIDGKQRIETVRAFATGRFLVAGWWWRPEDLFDPDCRAHGVGWDDLSQRGRTRITLAQLPGCEFKSGTEYEHVEPGTGDTGNARQYRRMRTRTEEEMVAAEAEVFLLINFGGVEQTDADHDRARSIAEGGT